MPNGPAGRGLAMSRKDVADRAVRPAAGETIDAFHRGAFHLVQPARGAHRAGMDAMLVAALVPDGACGRLADLGAGAGAAGLAVAARCPDVAVTLFERAPEMIACARRTLALGENARLAARIAVVEADVTARGRARQAAGLSDEAFDHVVMNPPFNDPGDRRAPEALRAEAHAMDADVFEDWIRTAGAIARPGGQLSLIARPQSIAEIVAACGRRFGGIEVTPVHPRAGEPAIRILVTAIKQSRARLCLRSGLVMHDGPGHGFGAGIDALNNGRAAYPRLRS